MGIIIDGKLEAQKVREGLKQRVADIVKKRGRAPKLCVVLVGDDPASQAYVRNKEKGCEALGMISEVQRIPATIKEKELIDLVFHLNKDKTIDGLLVQLPLPKHINTEAVLSQVSPEKDVDGLHPLNMGLLLRGEQNGLVACTPQGIMHLILSTGCDLVGKNAVVVGRSNIVGKPVALLLLQKHATVTICHSRTNDLGEVCRRADVLVAAVGSPGIIQGDMLKPGAVVIDVGTNRVGDKWVGDVDFESAKEKAGFITPVPGGVGPMTIAMLLKNTLLAAEKSLA